MEHAPRGREGRAENALFTSPKLRAQDKHSPSPGHWKANAQCKCDSSTMKRDFRKEGAAHHGRHLWSARGVVIPEWRPIVPGGRVCFPSPSTPLEPSTKQALYFPIVNDVCATSPSALWAIHQVKQPTPPWVSSIWNAGLCFSFPDWMYLNLPALWGILWEPLLEKLEVMPENSYVDKKFWLSKSFTGMIYLPSIAPHFIMFFHILQYF